MRIMIETEKMSFGQRLSLLRRQQSWTQDQAAERIGIHGRHLSRFETDKLFPSRKTLKRIAEVYAVTEEDLVPSTGERPIEIHDPRLLRTFEQAQTLEEEDKKIVMRIVQALLTKKKVERALIDEED